VEGLWKRMTYPGRFTPFAKSLNKDDPTDRLQTQPTTPTAPSHPAQGNRGGLPAFGLRRLSRAGPGAAVPGGGQSVVRIAMGDRNLKRSRWTRIFQAATPEPEGLDKKGWPV
jgi:hypothetical protein